MNESDESLGVTQASGGVPATDETLVRAVWKEARDLIKYLESTSVQRLAVQAGAYKIEIERAAAGSALPAPVGQPGQGSASGGAPTAAAGEHVEDRRIPVVAPLVGTFYRSAQPGSAPFVDVGDTVDQGQTVAIVEAMKIMNQVQTERPGKVVEILLKDGEWVEFEQVLMYLEPLEG
jgi:acetyl-CoA carboxylase biotin carboxyl carrier protein